MNSAKASIILNQTLQKVYPMLIVHFHITDLIRCLMLQIHTEYIVTKFKYKFVVISKGKLHGRFTIYELIIINIILITFMQLMGQSKRFSPSRSDLGCYKLL